MPAATVFVHSLMFAELLVAKGVEQMASRRGDAPAISADEEGKGRMTGDCVEEEADGLDDMTLAALAFSLLLKLCQSSRQQLGQPGRKDRT